MFSTNAHRPAPRRNERMHLIPLSGAAPENRKDTTMITTLARPLAAVALVALAGLGLAGCSGPAGTSGSSSSSNSALKYSNMDDWDAAWASCMREHGVRIGDDGLAEEDQDFSGYNESAQTCSDEAGLMPNGGLKASPDEQLKAWTTTAKCLRERGYDIPDPKLEPEGAWSLSTPRDMDEKDWNDCASLGWGVSPDTGE